MQKFYDMETMTQEKLNKLALERNTLEEENKYLSDKVIKYTEIVDQQAKTINELEEQLAEKDKEIEKLTSGCKELEKQVDDLYKLETTLTNEIERKR